MVTVSDRASHEQWFPIHRKAGAFLLQVDQPYPGTAPLILQVVAVLGWPLTLSKSQSLPPWNRASTTTTQRAWEVWTCSKAGQGLCCYLLLIGPMVNAWTLSPGAASAVGLTWTPQQVFTCNPQAWWPLRAGHSWMKPSPPGGLGAASQGNSPGCRQQGRGWAWRPQGLRG